MALAINRGTQAYFLGGLELPCLRDNLEVAQAGPDAQTWRAVLVGRDAKLHVALVAIEEEDAREGVLVLWFEGDTRLVGKLILRHPLTNGCRAALILGAFVGGCDGQLSLTQREESAPVMAHDSIEACGGLSLLFFPQFISLSTLFFKF